MGESPMRSAETVGFRVPAGEAPIRLDLFLARRVPGLSRRRIRTLLDEGGIRVEGAFRPRGGAPLRGGEWVTLPRIALAPPAARPDPSVIVSVVYEDEEVAVVEKPSGIPTQPLQGGEGGTLVGGLLARDPALAGVGFGGLEPGILHRLDIETSGLVLVARTDRAFLRLRASFEGGEVLKGYVAWVEGVLTKGGRIDLPLAHDPRDPRRMAVVRDAPREGRARHGNAPREARTQFVPRAWGKEATRLEVEIRRGVMHQIRAHLAGIGHPVYGDLLYGGRRPSGLARHLLHAARLSFPHPTTGKRVAFASPIPRDFDRFPTGARGAFEEASWTT